ncbi:MAG: hypothetical protein ABJB61_08860 [bacterium]
MAEEVLVKESISSEMIAAGQQLARYLNDSELPTDALLWFYSPEDNAWRFVVATSEVRNRGPKSVYQQLRQIVSTIPAEERKIPLDNIFVLDSHDPLIQLLGSAVATGDEIAGIRFTRNVINGVLIEDAYIYKLRRI